MVCQTVPLVCMRVAFRENDGNRENDENDEDKLDSYKQGVVCWANGNDGNHGNPGCKPRVLQTTGLELAKIWDPSSHKLSHKLWVTESAKAESQSVLKSPIAPSSG